MADVGLGRSAKRWATVAIALTMTSLSACTSTGPEATRVSPSPTDSVGPLGAPGCSPVSPSGDFSAEIYGTAVNGTVWAWFMAGYPPASGVEDKTVWRVDAPGAVGSPVFLLIGPAGKAGRLSWGPDEHSGSSWDRPGREFGTGLVFTSSGCWDARVTLGKLTGDVYIEVA